MASFIKSFVTQVEDASQTPQTALFIKKDDLQKLAQAASALTAESALPTLNEGQRGRVPANTTAFPADLLTRLAVAIDGDAEAGAALGISAPEIKQVVNQTLTLHGYVTQAQQTEAAATGQGEVIADRSVALFNQLCSYYNKVKDEPAGVRPDDERDAILAVLTAPLSLWQAQRQREADGRKDGERVAAPLKEKLELSEQAVADLSEINRLLGLNRG